MIGPLPPPLDETTAYFKLLSDQIQASTDAEIEIVETTNIARSSGTGRLMAQAKVLGSALPGTGKRPDVISLHMRIGAMAKYGPAIVGAARTRKIPVIAHLIGGGLIGYEEKKQAEKLEFVYRHAAAALVETKDQLRELIWMGDRAHWFPTSRRASSEPLPPASKQCRHFVFHDQLVPDKGVSLLLEAFTDVLKEIPDATLTFYGSSPDDIYTAADFDQPGVSFGGELAPEQIQPTLARYDALVLPTYDADEVYPAAILDAYHAGRPVVATMWRSIPDIIADDSGVLIMPHDRWGLAQSMIGLCENDERYQKLARGAAAKASQYDVSNAANNYLSICDSVQRSTQDD